MTKSKEDIIIEILNEKKFSVITISVAEQAMDTYASELKQENERLTGLIEKAYDAGYADYDDVINTVRNRWTQFAADNNINPSA